ncbi:hypothetical protein VTJ04DRAFT_4467 [Mycothermus thermophilus]|uniref:uncharacterized protein n=1 Tax=Humicola insolens TaxID=85995 RepID=UPI00374494FD
MLRSSALVFRGVQVAAVSSGVRGTRRRAKHVRRFRTVCDSGTLPERIQNCTTDSTRSTDRFSNGTQGTEVMAGDQQRREDGFSVTLEMLQTVDTSTARPSNTAVPSRAPLKKAAR